MNCGATRSQIANSNAAPGPIATGLFLCAGLFVNRLLFFVADKKVLLVYPRWNRDVEESAQLQEEGRERAPESQEEAMPLVDVDQHAAAMRGFRSRRLAFVSLLPRWLRCSREPANRLAAEAVGPQGWRGRTIMFEARAYISYNLKFVY